MPEPQKELTDADEAYMQGMRDGYAQAVAQAAMPREAASRVRRGLSTGTGPQDVVWVDEDVPYFMPLRGDRDTATTDDTTPCNDCGKPYYERMGTWWRAPDALWLQVVGDVDIALCPGCFAGRAALLGVPIHLEAVHGV